MPVLHPVLTTDLSGPECWQQWATDMAVKLGKYLATKAALWAAIRVLPRPVQGLGMGLPDGQVVPPYGAAGVVVADAMVRMASAEELEEVRILDVSGLCSQGWFAGANTVAHTNASFSKRPLHALTVSDCQSRMRTATV